MVGIFVANTDGFWRKFTFSFAIKFFTYWQLKDFKQRHPDYKWMKMRDIPTHALVGFDYGQTNEKMIFESSKTQQLYPYYLSKYEFYFKNGVDIKLFWELVHESVGEWYGLFQNWYFVKTWYWETFYPDWFIKLWGKLFHGGKPILHWGNMFVASHICTEQAGNLCRKYDNKYNYPSLREEMSRASINNLTPLFVLDSLLSAEETVMQ